MGRQWNTIIESLGGLTGGTISINANLTDIDALLTTLQADVADGISITSGTVDFVRDIDYVKLLSNSNTISGPNYNYNLGYAKRTSEARWTLNSFYIWYNADLGRWEIVCTNEDDAGLVAYNSQNSKQVQNIPPQTGWAFSVDWSSTGFAISYEQPNVIPPARGATTIGTLTANTTNGTLFASNSNRNYLLVQCTSGTAYLDTNGTATTSDGILLTSGQGITFEGNFVPTGAITAITSTGTARLIGRQG
jgi:hypothetical protein